jgi:crotonobetainyl-CoA:carnitine CoA-transferase CaiB-like acyl-CoA transferase
VHAAAPGPEDEGPLTGLRVFDLSRILSGPYCTMALGDMGADVVKVERPGDGDDTRRWGPPYAGGESTYFLATNRSKRSIALDLRSAAGREVALRLAAWADVAVENFRPGTAARLGLDYASLRAVNPRLVYCSISGYGQSGPLSDRPGFDAVAQAEGGLMSLTGPVDGGPVKHAASIADLTAGLWALAAILAALWRRERDGEGQWVDMALLDGQLSLLTYIGQAYLATGAAPRRHGSGHAQLVPYQPLQTKDGPLMVTIGNERLFARFAHAVGRPDWLDDPTMATNAARVAHREQTVRRLEAVLSARTAAEWQEVLVAAGVPCGRIQTVPEALAMPHVRARNMVERLDHPTAGPIDVVGMPPKFSRTPARPRRAPPILDGDRASVLADLGYSDAQVRDLAARGAFGDSQSRADGVAGPGRAGGAAWA